MKLHPVCNDEAHRRLLSALHGTSFDYPWSVKDMTEILAMPGCFGFVGHHDADPLGFILARVAADEAEILTLCVQPGGRRRGHAWHLLDAALDTARTRGCRRMFLEVAADNAAARALYGRAGFTRQGRRRDYYKRENNRVDGMILGLSL